MDYDKIIRLILLKASGEASPEELSELHDWLGEDSAKAALVEELSDFHSLSQYKSVRDRIPHQQAYADMCRRLGIKKRSPLSKGVAWFSSAAAVIALAVWGIGYFSDRLSEQPAIPSVALVSVDQLHPGASKATLTLADGSRMELDSEKSVIPVTTVKKGKDDKKEDLCLEVPRGGEFMIVLEDSTKVWLNSASKLTYPEHFAEGSRHVSVEGEAYFEVAHDSSRPFYVEVPGAQYVKVYGTEFNVRSYPEDPEVRTTLCEGSISITQANGNGGELFLSPGHQAVYDKTTCVAKLRSADVERVSGWRNGRFVFEEQTLNQIMQDLSRWYDFDFEFADSELRETVFMGSIPRYSNFTTAIAILEKSGGIKFDVADNKVIISKN